jgi:hypothetical protein
MFLLTYASACPQVTILTNDGTPQHGRLSNRSCHSMLMRIKLDRASLGQRDCVGLVSLHEVGESTATFMRMYVENRDFKDSFVRYRDQKFGFKKHITIVCVDGGAMSHHVARHVLARALACSPCPSMPTPDAHTPRPHVHAMFSQATPCVRRATADTQGRAGAVFAPCRRTSSTSRHGGSQTVLCCSDAGKHAPLC